MSKPFVRRQLLVNGPIQGALITRVVLYWLMSMAIQAMLILFLSSGTGSGDELYQRGQQFWWQMQLVVVSSLFTLPLLVLDVVKLSHRWVGPIYRLRLAMQALAHEDKVPPLTFRAGDYWKELADDFNIAAERINRKEEACGKARAALTEAPSTEAELTAI